MARRAVEYICNLLAATGAIVAEVTRIARVAALR
jgi:hypothetical protein